MSNVADHQAGPPPAPAPGGRETIEEQHRQDALDEALAETFPSSDPVAVSIAPPLPAPR